MHVNRFSTAQYAGTKANETRFRGIVCHPARYRSDPFCCSQGLHWMGIKVGFFDGLEVVSTSALVITASCYGALNCHHYYYYYYYYYYTYTDRPR